MLERGSHTLMPAFRLESGHPPAGSIIEFGVIGAMIDVSSAFSSKKKAVMGTLKRLQNFINCVSGSIVAPSTQLRKVL